MSGTIIVDYGRGNLFSLSQALTFLGITHRISADPSEVVTADRVVLPGVGAFGDGMAALEATGLAPALREVHARGTRLVGICLGMQLMAARGEEFGDHAGLGLIPGVVRRLPEGEGDEAIRVPNVGWRRLRPTPGGAALLDGRSMMYFVHSYAMAPEDPAHVMATITFNGQEVAVAVRAGNSIGVQFHPEKSGPAGLTLLRHLLDA